MDLAAVRSDIKTFTQTVLYLVTVLLGFMASIPIGVTSNDMDGNCILYTKIVTHPRDFGPRSNCRYVIGVNVLFSILLAASMAGLYGYAVYLKTQQQKLEVIHNFNFTALATALHACATSLCFIASCIVSAGFKKYCGELKRFTKVDDCSTADDLLHASSKGQYSKVHAQYTLSIITCWLLTFCWLIQGGISGIILYRQMKSGQTYNVTTVGAPTTNLPSTAYNQTTVSVVDRY